MMTPKQIRDCRRTVEQRITGNSRAGHNTDRLIRTCLPEVLDEVERLREGLVEISLLLMDMPDIGLDAKSFEGDLVSLALNAAKETLAELDECLEET